MITKFSHILRMGAVAAVLSIATFSANPAYAICETNAEVTEAQGNAITRQADEISRIIANLQQTVSVTLPVQLTDLIGKITNLSDSFRLGLGERASELENALQAETMQESVAIQDQTQNLLATQSAAVHNDALMDRGAELSEIRTKNKKEKL